MSPSGPKTTSTKFLGVNLRVTINFIKCGLASCCKKVILEKNSILRIWLWFLGMFLAVTGHLYFFSPYHVLQVTFWSWIEGYKWSLTYLSCHPHYSPLPFLCGLLIRQLSLSTIINSHSLSGWVLSYTEGYTDPILNKQLKGVNGKIQSRVLKAHISLTLDKEIGNCCGWNQIAYFGAHFEGYLVIIWCQT